MMYLAGCDRRALREEDGPDDDQSRTQSSLESERLAQEKNGEHKDEHDAQPIECGDAGCGTVAKRKEVEEPGCCTRGTREDDEEEGPARDVTKVSGLPENERGRNEKSGHDDCPYGGRKSRIDFL